jgi:hypothetical protein
LHGDDVLLLDSDMVTRFAVAAIQYRVGTG